MSAGCLFAGTFPTMSTNKNLRSGMCGSAAIVMVAKRSPGLRINVLLNRKVVDLLSNPEDNRGIPGENNANETSYQRPQEQSAYTRHC
jgi:hypothetical protein